MSVYFTYLQGSTLEPIPTMFAFVHLIHVINSAKFNLDRPSGFGLANSQFDLFP
jgi:hypothetical protein